MPDPTPLTRFRDRVAVITGAGGGIGAATALRLAAEGATVVLADRDEAAADRAAQAVRDAGGSAHAVGLDVADAGQVDETFRRVAEEHGRLDVLVNNAGITRDDLLFKATEEDWDLVLNVNLKSVFLCSRAAQRTMVEAKRGAIVSLSSRSALGNRGQSNYSASKAGIRGLTATMAIELGPLGVRVNAVAPGYIATQMTAATAERVGAAPEDHQAMAAKMTPLRRVGQPAEVAAVIAFLASDDAGYVSGQTIEINGGTN